MADKKYVNEMMDKFLEEVNSPASEDVVRTRNTHAAAVDLYVAMVFEDAWKKGFAYAMQIWAGKQ